MEDFVKKAMNLSEVSVKMVKVAAGEEGMHQALTGQQPFVEIEHREQGDVGGGRETRGCSRGRLPQPYENGDLRLHHR